MASLQALYTRGRGLPTYSEKKPSSNCRLPTHGRQTLVCRCQPHAHPTLTWTIHEAAGLLASYSLSSRLPTNRRPPHIDKDTRRTRARGLSVYRHCFWGLRKWSRCPIAPATRLDLYRRSLLLRGCKVAVGLFKARLVAVARRVLLLTTFSILKKQPHLPGRLFHHTGVRGVAT